MGMRLRHRNPVVPGTQAAPALARVGQRRDMPMPWQAALVYRPRPTS